MLNLKNIIGAVGTLFPIIFPDKEFQPKRLGAVVIIAVLVFVGIHFVGEENIEAAIEHTETLIELTEE